LGIQGEAAYAASKSAVETYSRILAKEVSGYNVRVNCVAPGPISTELLKGVSDEQILAIIANQVIPRKFDVEDVTDVVELLLDPRASSLSGQVISVGGS
jgi:3-oxoacyl-[acyl-carrier protein] reductase